MASSPPPPLTQRIARRIAHLGPMTLAEYMTAALCDADYGYYMTGDPFGARGDFVTAPEISQMFGELIGLWCAETWGRMGAPNPVQLVELGPGRGTLMADALRAARTVPGFLEAARVHLVEVSPALQSRQSESLRSAGADLGMPPRWHDNFSNVPHGPLLLIANEFFDALPIRQFVRCREGSALTWRERVVGLSEDRQTLAFALAPATMKAAALLPPEAAGVGPGGTFEVSPASAALAGEIGARIAEDGGAALVIDYGAARPAGEATLQGVRRHARHDVLEAPGQADLTAHVDFVALAGAAEAAGAKAWGPMPQGTFLTALGIAARAEALTRAANPAQARGIATALERLTGPAQMGELFKVLALAHPALGALAGFS